MSGKQMKRLRKVSGKLAEDTGQHLLPEMRRFHASHIYKELKERYKRTPNALRGQTMAHYGKYYTAS